MYHIVCCIILGIFIILGITDLIIFLKSNILKSKKSENVQIFFIPLSGHLESLEYNVRTSISEMQKSEFLHKTKIVFIDCGLDKETKQICNTLCKIYRENLSLI